MGTDLQLMFRLPADLQLSISLNSNSFARQVHRHHRIPQTFSYDTCIHCWLSLTFHPCIPVINLFVITESLLSCSQYVFFTIRLLFRTLLWHCFLFFATICSVSRLHPCVPCCLDKSVLEVFRAPADNPEFCSGGLLDDQELHTYSGTSDQFNMSYWRRSQRGPDCSKIPRKIGR